MAGRRHHAGRPQQDTLSAQRRSAAYAERLATAATPSRRVAVAADALRALLVRLPHDTATTVSDAAIADLDRHRDTAATLLSTSQEAVR